MSELRDLIQQTLGYPFSVKIYQILIHFSTQDMAQMILNVSRYLE